MKAAVKLKLNSDEKSIISHCKIRLFVKISMASSFCSLISFLREPFHIAFHLFVNISTSHLICSWTFSHRISFVREFAHRTSFVCFRIPYDTPFSSWLKPRQISFCSELNSNIVSFNLFANLAMTSLLFVNSDTVNLFFFSEWHDLNWKKMRWTRHTSRMQAACVRWYDRKNWRKEVTRKILIRWADYIVVNLRDIEWGGVLDSSGSEFGPVVGSCEHGNPVQFSKFSLALASAVTLGFGFHDQIFVPSKLLRVLKWGFIFDGRSSLTTTGHSHSLLNSRKL
jgi:hypothetical protein